MIQETVMIYKKKGKIYTLKTNMDERNKEDLNKWRHTMFMDKKY